MRKASVATIVPGARPSPAAASRVGRRPRAATSLASGGKSRAAAIAAASARRPGSSSRTSPALSLVASRSSPATPPRSAVATTSTATTATRSGTLTRPARPGSDTLATTNIVVASSTATAIASPRGEPMLSPSTPGTGSPAGGGEHAARNRPGEPTHRDTGDGHGGALDQGRAVRAVAGRRRSRSGGDGTRPGLAACHAPREPRTRAEARQPHRRRGGAAGPQRSRCARPREAPARARPTENEVDRAVRARAAALDLRDQVVDLPEVRLPARERPHPGVAAIGAARAPARRPDAATPSATTSGRGGGPVVAAAARRAGATSASAVRVVGALEEVAEQLPRAERCGADLDEPQTGRVRDPPHAAQAGAPRTASRRHGRGSRPDAG